MFIAFYGQEWYARRGHCAPYSNAVVDFLFPRHWNCYPPTQNLWISVFTGYISLCMYVFFNWKTFLYCQTRDSFSLNKNFTKKYIHYLQANSKHWVEREHVIALVMAGKRSLEFGLFFSCLVDDGFHVNQGFRQLLGKLLGARGAITLESGDHKVQLGFLRVVADSIAVQSRRSKAHLDEVSCWNLAGWHLEVVELLVDAWSKDFRSRQVVLCSDQLPRQQVSVHSRRIHAVHRVLFVAVGGMNQRFVHVADWRWRLRYHLKTFVFRGYNTSRYTFLTKEAAAVLGDRIFSVRPSVNFRKVAVSYVGGTRKWEMN